MRYSKGALPKNTSENTPEFSGGAKGISLPAVSVLQKAAPEEELQMKRIIQKAAPEEELQMKSVVQKAVAEEELQMKSFIQKAAPEEELQMKSIVQKASPEEELQMKSVVQKAAPEEELQMKSIVQKASPEEELQMKSVVQKVTAPEEELQMKSMVQRKENKTGMPDQLKSGIENLSGMDMSDVKVHYNSSQPAQLHALAYAQGNDIHIGPGQEQHLAHEAWHVVQQRQGRVKPTVQMKESVAVNDDPGLEHEADVMGAKAAQLKSAPGNVIQMQQTDVYAKQIVGTYTDNGGQVQNFTHNEDLYLTTTKSHPNGMVDYSTDIIKALKKNRTIPRDATNISITSYEQFGRRA